MQIRTTGIALVVTATLSACVTETAYVYQDVTTGETLNFAAVAEARRECGESIEVPQEDTKGDAIYASTPETATVALVSKAVKDVTKADQQKSKTMAAYDKCLLAKGIKKVPLS